MTRRCAVHVFFVTVMPRHGRGLDTKWLAVCQHVGVIYL